MPGRPVTFSLSPGQRHDAPEGRKLLRRLGRQRAGPALVMDRAYEGDATRQLALDLGFTPDRQEAAPPLKTRTEPPRTATRCAGGRKLQAPSRSPARRPGRW